MIAFAYGCIIETALKRPEARALEHFLFHFEKFTSSWKSEALSVVERRHHSSRITIRVQKTTVSVPMFIRVMC